MKRFALMGLFLCLGLREVLADPPLSTTPARQIHKVLVWGLGTDRANIEKVEIDVLEALADHQTAGDPAYKIFPNGIPASDAIAQMRADGCDALLALRRTSTIDWQTPSEKKTLSSLQSFLARRSQLINSQNEAVKQANAPIEVASPVGHGGWDISKGEGIVFDLASGDMIWRGDTQIKSAHNLPLESYYRMVAQKVADDLTTAGLIPPGKKPKFSLPLQ